VNRPLAAGLILVGLLSLCCLAAPFLTTWRILASPLDVELEAQLQPPSAAHWLGTDNLGRDVLARILHGGRWSLEVALVATGVALLLGLPAGLAAGRRGGWGDLILTRLMEATAALPALPLILLIVSMAAGSGERGAATMALVAAAIGATRWAAIARYVRGGIWKAAGQEYAVAAVALGSGRIRLFARHLLPGALSPALVSAAFGAGSAILAESGLSFLGMGIQPPAPSWGRMVAAATGSPQAWWLIAAPGGAIALVVLGFNLAAEGLREWAGRGRGSDQDLIGLRLPDR
jgi:peptide/nickel transport system permease protein